MQKIFDTIEKRLSSGRAYILLSAGVLCLCFLLTAVFSEKTAFSDLHPDPLPETEQFAMQLQTVPSVPLLRLTVRPNRPCPQSRSNGVTENAILPRQIVCSSTKTIYSYRFCCYICTWHSCARKTRPVRAGPSAV